MNSNSTQRIYPVEADWTPRPVPERNAEECLFDIQHPEILDGFGVDIRDVVYAWCQYQGLSKIDTDSILEPYLVGFHKVSDGLSVPDWIDRFAGLKGRAKEHSLEHHPVGVRHDYDWRIGVAFRWSNRRFRRLARATDFTRREARRMWVAVTYFGWPIYMAHSWRRRRDYTYAHPPW